LCKSRDEEEADRLLTDLEWKYPLNILFLGLAIAAVVFFILAFGKKERIMAMFHAGYKARFKALRTVLLGAGLCLMVTALMGPQAFAGYAEVRKTGLDIYVLMDTSKSMLVSDIAPDRMTVAKKIVGNLLDRLEGDRIGFIPFASDAYIQMPLTDDYQLARMFLNVMDTDMIGGGGTNLAAAINLAAGSFERTSGADKVILILSDGEEHDEASLDALKNITDERVKIFAVGIGTEKGGLVPVYNDAGDAIIDYIKDADGNPVTSRLNADTLKRLAQEGRGAYYQATLQGTEMASLLEGLSGLKKEDYQVDKIRRFHPLYQYFLGPGLLLFSIAWFLPERRMAA
jgi:Ca-activated chloride channel family protein